MNVLNYHKLFLTQVNGTAQVMYEDQRAIGAWKGALLLK